MSQNIHIFIHDAPSDRRRRGGVSVDRSGLGDPGRETTQSQPDDPGRETTQSEPDDPGRETTQSQPDDPRGGFFPLPYGYGCPPPCGCGDGGEARSAPRPELRPRDDSGFVIVRLAPGVDAGSHESLDRLAASVPLPGLLEALRLEGGGDAESDEDGGSDEDGAAPPSAAAGPGGHGEPGDGGQGDGGQGEGEHGDSPIHDARAVHSSAPGPLPGVLVSRPLIEAWGCRTREMVTGEIRTLEQAAQSSPLRPRHSLTAYWRVDLRAHPQWAGEVVERLNALPEVDLAYRELAATDPVVLGSGAAYGEDQSYLDDAPLGIGARWAWRRLPQTGPQVNVCDLEQRWNPQHDDLGSVPDAFFHGANRDAADEEGGFGHHGTAVLGELAAASDYGVRGGAQPVGRFSLSSHYLSRSSTLGSDTPHPFAGTNGHVAAAIFYALVDPDPARGLYPLRAGDVLLLEVQRALLPTEVDAADFDAIRLACALGVTVVEAAGNGGRDLDAYVDPDTGRSLRRGDPRFRDSGAILVGAAGSSLPHDRASFSNHGSRVDCYAWGDSVTSCGYGDLAGDDLNRYYTNTFAGTSSAAPIIAAAAALVQALHGDGGDGGGRLAPLHLRSLLASRATGTPQGPGVPGHIGVMPNLCALLRDELQLVPDVYPRRHPCDDGARPAPGGEISSSPDLVVLPAGARADLGEGPAANDPAPGIAAVPGGGLYDVHLRLRNRGRCPGCVEAKLFASPAATLITPDFWQRIPDGTGGPPLRGKVLQGDLLTPVGPIENWRPAMPAPVPDSDHGLPPYALLAVVEEVDCDPPAEGGGAVQHYPAAVGRCEGLPPGGRDFDWDAYRAFLRRSGVAWRNVHRVTVQGGQADLPFLFAGTPDRARRFDFEVVCRLPKGATVRLEVPRGLGAKLRQAQPLLRAAAAGPTSGTQDAQGSQQSSPSPPPVQRLELPGRPRLPIRRVTLAAGTCPLVAFRLSGLGSAAGHSLALRQIWRGEEVGRITWYLEAGGTASEVG